MSWEDILKKDSNAELKSFADKLNNYNLITEEYFRKGWKYRFHSYRRNPKYTDSRDAPSPIPKGEFPHTDYFEATNEEEHHVPDNATKYFAIKMKDKYVKGRAENPLIFEYVKVKYEPVPEEVAAKALELLKSHKETKSGWGYGGTDAGAKVGEYNIHRRLNLDVMHNSNNLIIDKDGEEIVVLSWGNGETGGAKEPYLESYERLAERLNVPEITMYISEQIPALTQWSSAGELYNASGYYDSRNNFGLIWHEK